MKLYTSYYGKLKAIKKQNPEIVAISISTTYPRFVKNVHELKDLAPERWVLEKTKSGEFNDEDYYFHFNNKLSKGPDQIEMIEIIKKISGGKDAILLCYEKDCSTCHRSRVREWFKEAGIIVSELLVHTSRQKKPTQYRLF